MLSYFLENNKSGYKSTEKWLSKNNTDLHTKIINHSKINNIDSIPFKEKIYLYCINLTSPPKCLNCSNKTKFVGTLKKGYNEFCSEDCFNSSKYNKERVIKAMQEKYGLNSYSKTKEYVTKVKKTKVERYGDENYNNFEKAKATKIEKYNDEFYVNTEKQKQSNLEKYGTENISNSEYFKNLIKQNFYGLYPNLSFIDKDCSGSTMSIFCEKCNKVYKTTKSLIRCRTEYNSELCTNCNKKGAKFISSAEIDIVNFLNDLGISNIITSDKEILDGKELDIFLPDHNIAIEFDGLYYHSNLFIDDKNYHLNKTIAADKKGIRLIHIFEDEWMHKKDIVKSRLKSIIGLSEHKIFARKCFIKELNS